MHVNYFHTTKLIDLADGGLYREKRKEAPIRDAKPWLNWILTLEVWNKLDLEIFQFENDSFVHCNQ